MGRYIVDGVKGILRSCKVVAFWLRNRSLSYCSSDSLLSKYFEMGRSWLYFSKAFPDRYSSILSPFLPLLFFVSSLNDATKSYKVFS